MKPRHWIDRAWTSLAFACALASLAAASDVAFAAEPATASIRINVGTFRNRNGKLGCRLFKSAAGFPDGSAGTVEVRVPITGATTLCSFEGLAPGTYAVAVMHDENDNQKLDKSLFGVPVEGYGVSNNHTYALSAPTWEESKIRVEPGQSLGLGISLRY